VGRNGAGKTTLLRVLSGITRPTRGQVSLRGRLGALLEVGAGFHPELTGRENIFVNGTILGMRRAEIVRKFDQIVAFSEIEPFLDTPVKHYSSGMHVRLAFAVAAHLEPEILLVDEILAVGDAAFQKKCLGKISEAAGTGRTILFVSHNMDAIQRVCRRAILLEHGRILASGEPEAVVRTYLEGFEAAGRFSPTFSPGSPLAAIDCRINGQPAGRSLALRGDEPLELAITCQGHEPIACPRADLTFYRFDALRLFTMETDRLLDFPPGVRARRWEIRLRFPWLPLAPASYYFDIGLRREPQGEYQALWNHVGELTTTGGLTPVTADSLLAPAAEVSVRPIEEDDA
jgi:lipopolysaccharide transport system ATP-binding protein